MDMAVINAAMQTPNVQAGGMPQALGADGGLQGLFAMLFGQLLGQADAEGALEDPVLGTMLSSMKDGEADDTQLRLAMEMMAGMLAAPQATEWLSAQTDTAAADGIVQAAGAQNLLLQQLQARFAPAEQQVQTQADEDVRGTDWDALLQTLETAWETKADGQDPSAGLAREMDRMQFASAVRQVRELMSEKPRAGRDQTNRPLDVEALQAAVDSRQYVPETVSARSEAPALHEIADQLKTGILDNLRQGKNEFVVKLKPEGLGEITVKLTESKNEISLRIVTSSTAVGKMIADEVNALQNALRPLRAQVQEIVTVPAAQENAAGAMLAGGQGEQQFAWHYQNQQQGGGTRADDGADFEEFVEEAVPDDANVNVLI